MERDTKEFLKRILKIVTETASAFCQLENAPILHTHDHIYELEGQDLHPNLLFPKTERKKFYFINTK